VNADEKIARVARAAHNTLMTYNRLTGDYSIKEWEDAEAWQRESTIDMVKAVIAGTFSPKAEHERWLKTKLEKGYVYGAVRNDDASAGPLTNPSILPYEQLPLVLRMRNDVQYYATLGYAAHYGLTPST
jgi:hypothetical protein